MQSDPPITRTQVCASLRLFAALCQQLGAAAAAPARRGEAELQDEPFPCVRLSFPMAPLHDAAKSGDAAAVRRLLDAGGDVNEKVDGVRAL